MKELLKSLVTKRVQFFDSCVLILHFLTHGVLILQFFLSHGVLIVVVFFYSQCINCCFAFFLITV